MHDCEHIEPEAIPVTPTPLEQLRALWAETLEEEALQIDEGIDELINCDVVSIRYALLTQLVGKFCDAGRDALSIQRGEAETADAAGRWDARSFCKDNVVPWVAETGQVLGTSPDPYVNNPLRRPRLDAGYEPRRDRPQWDKLTKILQEVQTQDNLEFTEQQLRRCLASLMHKYNALNVQFDVPQRISLEATVNLVDQYMAAPSGGERPQIIVAALMRIVGNRFGLFDRVSRQAINEADAASNRPGDVICFQGDEQVFAVEVKDRALELSDVETVIVKARRNNVTEVLFANSIIREDDGAIDERVQREFGLGINIYELEIGALLRVVLTIAGEDSRTEFLEIVGEELNERVTQPSHKIAWQELLLRL